MSDGQFQKLMKVDSIGSGTVSLVEISSGDGLGEGRPEDLDITAITITTEQVTPPSWFWKAGDQIFVELSRPQ